MNTRSIEVALIAVGAFLVGCHPRLSSESCVPHPEHVIFVGFDGLTPRGLKGAKTPTVDKMISEGTVAWNGRSILPSSSACNWHSIFTCSASEQHGFNAWDSKRPAFEPTAKLASGLYPDVFAVLRSTRPSAEIGLLYNWSGLAYCLDTNACSYVCQAKDAQLAGLAADYIKSHRPAFLAVIYDSPDDIGHKMGNGGWDSPEYTNRVEELDVELGIILRAIEESGIAGDTVVVVSSDHGGLSGHGGALLSHMLRPVILRGPGVKVGYELAYGGTTYDLGATFAMLLGVGHSAWIGRPLLDAFE